MIGMHTLTPAAEGPVPFQGPTPADQQPTDLSGALAMADQIMWRDGGVTKEEIMVFNAFVESTIMKIQAAMAEMQQGAAGASELGDSNATGDWNQFSGQGGQDMPQPGYGGGY